MTEKTPEKTIEEKAQVVPTMLQMLPRLALDPTAALGRFIGLFCSLCHQIKIDPVKYMSEAVAEYAKMDAERQAAKQPRIINPADEKKIVGPDGAVIRGIDGGKKMSGENWRNMKIPFRTRSKLIDLATLCADDIDENDIAFTLARTFRFNGATDQLYSVAQHSFMCASVAPQNYKLAALLHDAHEYILGDIARPVQVYITEHNHRFFDVIHDLKFDLDCRIEERFDFEGIHSTVVGSIDKRMLATEMIYLFGENYTDYEPYLGLNETWSPEKSEKLFLETLKGLMNARKNISK